MPQPEPFTADQGSDQGSGQKATSHTIVKISGSENITVTDARAGRDLNITQTIHQAPKANPTLPAATPHNLPDRTTSSDRFVGRAAELQRLTELLSPDGSRVYLTGMGGLGKSELALPPTTSKVVRPVRPIHQGAKP